MHTHIYEKMIYGGIQMICITFFAFVGDVSLFHLIVSFVSNKNGLRVHPMVDGLAQFKMSVTLLR